MIKSLLGVLLLALSLNAGAQDSEMGVRNLERSIFFTATSAQGTGKVMCLENKTEEKESLQKGWYIMTCTPMDVVPRQWVVCFVNPEKKSFICGVKPS